MFRFNSLDLKWETARFVRELLALCLSDRSFEWSRDYCTAVNELIFAKLTDQRDQKMVINKILPEVCETIALLMRAHASEGRLFWDTCIDDFLDTYQQVSS